VKKRGKKVSDPCSLAKNVIIRAFKEDDTIALAEVYRDAVHSLGPQAYSREQVAMWARFSENLADFKVNVSRGLTLVAEVDDRLMAFGQLDPIDHVALLYCRGCAARQGLGSHMYCALEAHAFSNGVAEIRTEASRISRPFFEKHGFVLRETEHIVRFGVEFERFRMTKNRVQKAPEPTPGSVTSNVRR